MSASAFAHQISSAFMYFPGGFGPFPDQSISFSFLCVSSIICSGSHSPYSYYMELIHQLYDDHSAALHKGMALHSGVTATYLFIFHTIFILAGEA